MGSGTTGIAALKLKLQFIGIEKDPYRYAIAQANIAHNRS
jgi:DNA modification methylase